MHQDPCRRRAGAGSVSAASHTRPYCQARSGRDLLQARRELEVQLPMMQPTGFLGHRIGLFVPRVEVVPGDLPPCARASRDGSEQAGRRLSRTTGAR